MAAALASRCRGFGLALASVSVTASVGFYLGRPQVPVTVRGVVPETFLCYVWPVPVTTFTPTATAATTTTTTSPLLVLLRLPLQLQLQLRDTNVATTMTNDNDDDDDQDHEDDEDDDAALLRLSLRSIIAVSSRITITIITATTMDCSAFQNVDRRAEVSIWSGADTLRGAVGAGGRSPTSCETATKHRQDPPMISVGPRP